MSNHIQLSNKIRRRSIKTLVISGDNIQNLQRRELLIGVQGEELTQKGNLFLCIGLAINRSGSHHLKGHENVLDNGVRICEPFF